jgi:hypothetical protein
MAFGLAVYASPGGLPRLDARLASSRWSDATGRASTRRVPTKGFRGVILTSLPPSPSFAWRNHIDRSTRRVSSRLDPLLYACHPRLVNGYGSLSQNPCHVRRSTLRCCRATSHTSPITCADTRRRIAARYCFDTARPGRATAAHRCLQVRDISLGDVPPQEAIRLARATPASKPLPSLRPDRRRPSGPTRGTRPLAPARL